MLTMNRLELVLKNKYNIAVGEKTLDELKHKINEILKTKIKISGRSYKTGRRKTIAISLMSPIC